MNQGKPSKKGISIGAAMKERMSGSDTALESDALSAPKSQPDDPLESFNTRLPRSLQKRLKVYVAMEDRKIQDVLCDVLDAYLTEKDY